MSYLHQSLYPCLVCTQMQTGFSVNMFIRFWFPLRSPISNKNNKTQFF